MQKVILVTGSCGFIGSSLIQELLKDESNFIIGIDNFSPYYSVSIKRENLKRNSSIRFINYEVDITDKKIIDKIFNEWNIKEVYHLAAQAGVQYSMQHEEEVFRTNVIGFINILKNCIEHKIKHVLYASSSSVYGDLKNKECCSESDEITLSTPKSPYAKTKYYNELTAETYSRQSEIILTGMRFFTVYGPYMRPDLAISKFVRAIKNDEPIEIYGNTYRDFTYIDDIVRIMIKLMKCNHTKKHEIFNIGFGKSISIEELVNIIKDYINPTYNKVIHKKSLEGDVDKTLASTQKLKKFIGDSPNVEIHEGIGKYLRC